MLDADRRTIEGNLASVWAPNLASDGSLARSWGEREDAGAPSIMIVIPCCFLLFPAQARGLLSLRIPPPISLFPLSSFLLPVPGHPKFSFTLLRCLFFLSSSTFPISASLSLLPFFSFLPSSPFLFSLSQLSFLSRLSSLSPLSPRDVCGTTSADDRQVDREVDHRAPQPP